MLNILASCAEKEFWLDYDKKGRWLCGLKSTILCDWEHFTGNANCMIQSSTGTVVSLPIPKEAQQIVN